tara:strand:+ start:3793 stop:4443 length:651 start_codon:yes stop_codon:yes gene_type:complete
MKIALFTNNSEEALSASKIIQPQVVITKDCDKDTDLSEIDLLVSYCYRSRIDKSIFSKPKYGGINFHPAPLPKYRGFAVYNFGILNEEETWGVTVHCLEDTIDTGDIITSEEFYIDKTKETAKSLRDKSHTCMLKMMPKIIKNFKKLYNNRAPQKGKGRYYSKEMMDMARYVGKEDDTDTVNKKIRAFWNPPHDGAFIIRNGQALTLINKQVIKQL